MLPSILFQGNRSEEVHFLYLTPLEAHVLREGALEDRSFSTHQQGPFLSRSYPAPCYPFTAREWKDTSFRDSLVPLHLSNNQGC